MAARLAMILVTLLAACGGPDKPPATPQAEPVAAPEPADSDPPLATDTDIPEEPAALPKPAGDHSGGIKGTVTSATSGRALAGVTVFLEGPDGVLSATTDAEGNYEITGIPPGTHEVTFSYKRTEVVAEVDVAAASTTVVPVALTLKKTAPVIVN